MLFRQHTGRYDLVSSSGADTGADTFLRAGQRYLDRRVEIASSVGEIETTLPANRLTIDVPIRSVHQAWVYDPSTTQGMTELFRLDVQNLRKEYAASSGLSSVTAGSPKHYSVTTARTESDTPYTAGAKRLFILPPPSVAVTLVVRGSLYQKELTQDGDSNFWTQQEPLMLVTSAMLQIEMLYRNSAGQNDLLQALNEQIANLEMAQVEEDAYSHDRALNSWRYINEFPLSREAEGNPTAGL